MEKRQLELIKGAVKIGCFGTVCTGAGVAIGMTYSQLMHKRKLKEFDEYCDDEATNLIDNEDSESE